ncbi:MAG: diguanylate cyclase [bacterium]|nr:diguanylate cyclase [bacterium]
MRRAFLEHRECEAEYVTNSLGSFRDAAWAFISGLRRSLSVEQNADRRIGHRMRRLEGAVRGGAEFAIVLRDITPPVATDPAKRGMMAIRNLGAPYEGLDEPVRITISMGIARLRPGESASSWIERAGRALYQAKEGGRGRIEVDPIDLDES